MYFSLQRNVYVGPCFLIQHLIRYMHTCRYIYAWNLTNNIIIQTSPIIIYLFSKITLLRIIIKQSDIKVIISRNYESLLTSECIAKSKNHSITSIFAIVVGSLFLSTKRNARIRFRCFNWTLHPTV